VLEHSPQDTATDAAVSIGDRISYGFISLIHDKLYALIRDPYPSLRDAGLAPGQRVLEVGCGPGHFTVAAADLVGEFGHVCALDINPLAIARVRQRVAKTGTTNVEAMLSDVADTDMPDESFDLVFVFGLGHDRSDVADMWTELHRLLRPQGILAIEGRLHPPATLFAPLELEGRVSRYEKAPKSLVV